LENHLERVKETSAAVRERFEMALGGGIASLEREDAEEIARLLRVLGCFSDATAIILELRSEVSALEILLQNADNASDGTKWTQQARGLAASIEFSVKALLNRCGDVPYPFEHADGTVTLQTFLVQGAFHEDEVVRSFLRGRTVMDHFFQLYNRAIGRLAVHARAAEAKLFADEDMALQV